MSLLTSSFSTRVIRSTRNSHSKHLLYCSPIVKNGCVERGTIHWWPIRTFIRTIKLKKADGWECGDRAQYYFYSIIFPFSIHRERLNFKKHCAVLAFTVRLYWDDTQESRNYPTIQSPGDLMTSIFVLLTTGMKFSTLLRSDHSHVPKIHHFKWLYRLSQR